MHVHNISGESVEGRGEEIGLTSWLEYIAICNNCCICVDPHAYIYLSKLPHYNASIKPQVDKSGMLE